MMKACAVLVAVLSFAAVAGAQQYPTEPYEFLVAKFAAEEGRYDEALKLMDRVVASDPDNPVLLFERAMMLIDAGRVERALPELRRIAAMAPDFYDANRVLGRILLDRAGSDPQKLSEALTFLQAAYQANPDDLSTGMAVSQLLMAMERIDEAERVLATMVERAPDQRTLNYNYAQVLTRLGRAEESRQYLERTVLLDPTFGPAIMQLVELYQQSNDWLKAALVLEPLVGEDPMNLDLQRQQAFFFLRGGDARSARDRFRALVKADPNDTRSLFFYAEALNDLQEYAEAEQIFRRLLEKAPDDADLIASLGLSLSGQKKWDEAVAAFNRLLTLPNTPENLGALARTQLAYIDLQKENYDAAIETARSAFVFRDRPNPQAINVALAALQKQERYADAVALLAPIAAKYDSDPFVNARYVEALVRAGESAKAREHAALQAKIGGRNAISVAEAYIQADDFASAIDLMKSAIEEHPDEIDLQFQLGSIHERAGDRKAAEEVFLRLLEQDPDHAPTLNYLGYMWADHGVNLEQAHEMLIRAVGQEPNNGAYVDSLGWVYFRLGDLDLAEKYLTDAARLLPRDPTVHEHLGDVHARRGDVERALQLYRTALELEPAPEELDKLRSKIAEIERDSQTSRR